MSDMLKVGMRVLVETSVGFMIADVVGIDPRHASGEACERRGLGVAVRGPNSDVTFGVSPEQCIPMSPGVAVYSPLCAGVA